MAFRFRKKTDYGLTMIALMAQKEAGNVVSVREMQEFGLPRSFLVKIASDLIKAGIIGAKEGRSGGYTLLKKPNQVTLLTVVKALEGEISTAQCIGGKKCELEDKCPHYLVMKKLSDELAQVLAKYTVADFRKIK